MDTKLVDKLDPNEVPTLIKWRTRVETISKTNWIIVPFIVAIVLAIFAGLNGFPKLGFSAAGCLIIGLVILEAVKALDEYPYLSLGGGVLVAAGVFALSWKSLDVDKGFVTKLRKVEE